MNLRTRFGRLHPLVGFLAALTLFLSFGAFLLVRQQRAALIEETDKHLSHELGLFESIITEDFLRFDYDAVQQHATEFGGRFRDIVRIRVAGPDGAAFALYERREPSTEVSGHRHTFAYAEGKYITVSLDYDLVPMREKLRALLMRVALASVLFSAVVGSLLWHLLRRIAFSPLERAVADLNLANEHLEQRVAERTRDLLAANADLEREVAERQAAERALTVKDQAIRSSMTGIALADLEGRITFANPAMTAMWGFERPDDLQGLPVAEFWESPDAAHAVVRSLLDVGWWQGELKGRRRDGSLFDVSLQGSIVLDGGGRPIGMMGSFMDVTLQKRDTERLRESEAKFKSFAEQAIVGIYVLQDDFFRYCNPRFAEMFGYTTGELIGKVPMPALVHPEDLRRVEEQVSRRISGEADISDYEFLGRKKDGAAIQLEVYGSSLIYEGRPAAVGTILDITDRKASEAAIQRMLLWVQEEKNKSDAIIAAIGDGISIMDRDFRILYQNEEHKRDAGPHKGEYCYQAFHGRERNCEGCPVALSFGDGGIHTCERSRLTSRGPVHLEITTSALRDAAGNIAAGIEVVRDVTERVRVHKALRDSYEVQQIINTLLSMPLGERSLEEIVKEALSVILSNSWYASHPVGGIFLLDEASGDLVLLAQQGFHPAVLESCVRVPRGSCLCGRAALSREVQFTAAVDERHERGCRYLPPHGHYCVPIVMADAVLGVLVIYLESGHAHDAREEAFLVAAMNSFAGIIHRKRLETAQERMIQDLLTLLDTVSAARKEWQETFDSITDMISIHDESNTVIRANRAFARHFGREPKEIWGWKLNELDPDGRDAVLADLVADASHEGRFASREVSDPATGKIFHLFTFPLSSGEGSSNRVIHIIREVTEEREREMRLIMSERLASLGQMAAGIAHEINNPLAAIAGCVDGMSRRIGRGQFDPELFNRYLAIIRDEIVRSKGITTSMLSLVRKNSFEKRQVDIHQAITSALEIIGYQGRLKLVSVTKSFADGTPVILGSEGEFKQVLLVVLTNALDAMAEKGHLSVTTAVAGGALTIDITDSGSGIPVELAVRVFDPFFTTKGDQGGTGLGLSIARRIISAHRGAIQALPAPGIGTTIRITLPLEVIHPGITAQRPSS
ncbi:MAG: PAS domain S-box protein [Candidatus Methylomirabilia bacterium]